MTDAWLRRVWFVSAASLALWAVSVFSFVGYLAMLGPSGVQRRAADQFSENVFEMGFDPLVVLLGVTTLLGVLTVASLLYYSYAQWRSVRLERIALEHGFEE